MYKEWYHLLRLLGPAEVLGPAERECLSVSLVRSITSALVLQLSSKPDLAPENLFHALPNGGHECNGLCRGGCYQKWGSSFSSICSYEDDLAGTSSGRTVGVQIECKQLLYVLIMCLGVTNTRSYLENSSSNKKFLHRRVTRTGREYLAPLVRWEFAMSYCKSIMLRQIMCCLVMRLWIICRTGLLNDIV